MRSILLRASRSLYSTQPPPPQKKNIFKLPLAHNFSLEAIHSMQHQIFSAKSCKILAVAFKENINLVTDSHLYEIYQQLRKWKFTIDNSFHQIIAPISLQYIKVFNREQAITMNSMIMAMLELNIDNKPLWDALINKLDNENIYRYIPLYESAVLLDKLLDHPEYTNLGLTKKLIGVVHQQKLFYQKMIQTQGVLASILLKLENLKSDDPLLTEALKQLK